MAEESTYVDALRALGRREGPDEFTVQLGETTRQVHYYPGSSSHVMIETPYVGRFTPAASASYRGLGRIQAVRRPMEIALRKETPYDARAKRSGVSIEAELGEPEFDEAIYVVSPSAPEVIRHVLAAPEARASILAIVGAGIEPIVIDGDGAKISVRVGSFGGLPTDPRWLLGHVVTLATHLPEVQASGQRHPRRWGGAELVLGALASLGVIPPLMAMLTSLPARCYVSSDEGTSLACEIEDCCSPLFGGLGSGLALGLFAMVVLSRVVRGTSDAHLRRPLLFFLALILSLEASVFAAHVYAAVALR